MDELTERLQSLAERDATHTDPSPEAVDNGWYRLQAALALPATPAMASTHGPAAATVAWLFKAGVALAIASVMLRPADAEREPSTSPAALATYTRVHAWTADVAIAHARIAHAPATPEPLPPSPQPARKRNHREAAAPPPSAPAPSLAEHVRQLAKARAALNNGRYDDALTDARRLLALPGNASILPEARGVEALAACYLRLARAHELQAAYVRDYPNSALNGRLRGACDF